MLESSCFRLYEKLRDLKEAVQTLGVGPVCLSGSGSAMFCMVDDEDSRRLDALRDTVAGRTDCRCVVVKNNRW